MPPEDQPTHGADLAAWLETAAHARCAWPYAHGRACPYPAVGAHPDPNTGVPHLGAYCTTHGWYLASFPSSFADLVHPAPAAGGTEPPEDP